VASFESPIEAVTAAGLLYVASKEGRVWLVDDEPEPVLDITGLVLDQGERGLLGLAFPPGFPDDSRMFVHYTDTAGTTILASYQTTPDGRRVVDGSGSVLLTVPQPAANHNGGKIAFGPDGHLYMALGDGGRSNDAFGNGQNVETLLGAILRLDVSRPGVYVAPPDNPFSGEGAAELWAIGLRNPWRFTFDGNDLYIADVGQNAFEEIDVVSVAPVGYNFGWPITEGMHCFRPPSGCDADGLTLPLVEVAHGDGGTCSITGGVVYRGSAIPELAGHYVYSDYCGGHLRSFRLEDGVAVDQTDWTDASGPLGQVVAFGRDPDGEVLVMTIDGQVRRLVGQRS
jgi:glucose/arabinose dehydrogenase